MKQITLTLTEEQAFALIDELCNVRIAIDHGVYDPEPIVYEMIETTVAQMIDQNLGL
jgi:hypothetical protein